jgi:hypothetical protein
MAEHALHDGAPAIEMKVCPSGIRPNCGIPLFSGACVCGNAEGQAEVATAVGGFLWVDVSASVGEATTFNAGNEFIIRLAIDVK